MKPILLGLLSIFLLFLITLCGYYSIFYHKMWTIRHMELPHNTSIRIKLTQIVNSDEIQQKITATNISNIVFTKNPYNVATYDACLKQWYVDEVPKMQCQQRHISTKQSNELVQMLRKLADPSTIFLGTDIFFNIFTQKHGIDLTDLANKLMIPTQHFHFQSRRLYPSQIDQNHRKNMKNLDTLQQLLPKLQPTPCLYSNKPCRSHSVYETHHKNTYNYGQSSSIVSEDLSSLALLNWLGYSITTQNNHKISLWYRLQLFKLYQLYQKQLKLIHYIKQHSNKYEISKNSIDIMEQWLDGCHYIHHLITTGQYHQSWSARHYQPDILTNNQVCPAYLFPQDYEQLW